MAVKLILEKNCREGHVSPSIDNPDAAISPSSCETAWSRILLSIQILAVKPNDILSWAPLAYMT